MTKVIMDEDTFEADGDGEPMMLDDALDEQLIAQLADRARSEGLQLTGEGGLLARLTKAVVESAVEGEMDDHLGYTKHDPAGRDGGNSRNGTRTKTMLTDIGPVEIQVPRDRAGSFEPQLVRKRQRRLSGVDDLVISLSAKGLTHGEISAHLAEVYGAQVSKQTISTITDRVIEGMSEWQNRPLDPVYPVIFIDAVNVKIRDGNGPTGRSTSCSRSPSRAPVTCTGSGPANTATGRDIQVLAARVERDQEPRHQRRVHRGVRRPERAARSDRNRVAASDHANMCSSLAAQQFPLRVEEGLDRDREGSQAGLHGSERGRRARCIRRVRPEVGKALSGDHQAVGERLGRVRAVPGLRQGNSHGDLHDQRHRKPELADPQGRQRPRPLPTSRPRSSASSWRS